MLHKNKMMKNESYEFLRGYENNHINIGFGSYGQVKLARNTQTKELVAIKLIYNKNAKDEIALHKRFDHPSIVKLLNYYYEEKKNITYMVLEYADGGTLFEKIKSSYMSKDVIRKIFRQVCEAVGMLHSNGIMHRDIKPQNILLTKKNDAKLCDFGFAALLGERKTLCGTYQYMAPQMVQGMGYDYTIDIWALGILLFEMVAGVAPFRGESPEEVLTEMKRSIIFSEKFEKEEINLIKNILRVNPSKRPSVTQILEHPYFQPEKLCIEKAVMDRTYEKQPEKSVYSTHASEDDYKAKGYTPKPRTNNDSFSKQGQIPKPHPTSTHQALFTNKPLPTTSFGNQGLYNPIKQQKVLNTSSGMPLPDYRTTLSAPQYTPSNEQNTYTSNNFFQPTRKN